LLPSWLYDIIRVIFSSTDDSCPPPLEVDHEPEVTKTKKDVAFDDTDWLVFDPDLGVISRELQEQWKQESLQRQDQYDGMKKKRIKKQLPPVRK
jgi:hypothetical protein